MKTLRLNDPARTNPLSPQQTDLVNLAAEGSSNDEIALRLGICTQTVKNIFTTIFYRLEAKNRAHAVAICIRRGII